LCKVFVDNYKGIHLAVSLRRIPICGPAIGSLNLPLVATIGIIGRKRKITYKQVNNKAKPE
jgi:hypothetical protein